MPVVIDLSRSPAGPMGARIHAVDLSFGRPAGPGRCLHARDPHQVLAGRRPVGQAGPGRSLTPDAAIQGEGGDNS